MGNAPSSRENADSADDNKAKKTKKYEAPSGTRVGRKKKKVRSGACILRAKRGDANARSFQPGTEVCAFHQ